MKTFLSVYLSVSDSHSHILRKWKASLYWLSYERTHSFFIFIFLISSCFTLIQVCILGVLPTPQSPQETEFPLSSAVDLGPLALHLREWRHELRILSLWDLVSDPISQKLQAGVAVYKVNYVTSL